VLAKIQAAVAKAAQAPAVQQRLSELGMEPDVSVDTPALSREVQAMSERNAAIVRKFNVKAN